MRKWQDSSEMCDTAVHDMACRVVMWLPHISRSTSMVYRLKKYGSARLRILLSFLFGLLEKTG